jgi:hypothetical protein
VKVQRILIFLVIAALYCTGSWAATIVVSNALDSGSGSLRSALAASKSGDTIDASSVTGTIFLTTGELLVTNSVKIFGPGPAYLTVDGNYPRRTNRVFNVASTVSLSGVTITNGFAPGITYAASCGGGIYIRPQGAVTVSNCTLSGNSANTGGAIYNDGIGSSPTVTVNASAISGNSARNSGGGIYNHGDISSPIVTIIASTLSGNSAPGGGGILNSSTYGNATVVVSNSTLSGNTATNGGGIFTSEGTVMVSSSTFSGNTATQGGGILYGGGGTVTIANTILKAGSSGSNLVGSITSLGYNLSSDDGGGHLNATGDRINTDPKLGPLQDNGGPTKTHALLSGSPAIDAGDPNSTSSPDVDQRGSGFPRIVNGRLDIGAFEFTPDLLVTAVDRIGDDLRLTFGVALLGEDYEVQSRTNLNFGTWESLPGSITGNGSTTQVTVTNAFSISPQFYRIHQLPAL